MRAATMGRAGWLMALGLVAACRWGGAGEAEPVAERVGLEPGEVKAPAEAEDLDPDPRVLQVKLRAEALDDGAGGVVYAYNGQRPGPTLRARVGDRLVVELENGLEVGTTIHWHGLKVPFEMDGVTWMGAPVGPGETFTYTFELTQAGTYWYHPHFNTASQVDRGLYGALIVENPEEPEADEELVLLLDSPDEDVEPDKGHGHGRLVTAWWVNGHLRPTLTLPGGARVRARLINVSNVGYLDLSWPGLRQIGSDQGLLPEPAVEERLVLGPGDRADVELLIGEQGWTAWSTPYSLNGGATLGEPVALFDVAVDGPAPPPEPLEMPYVAQAPSPDPGYTDIVYALAGSDRTGEWRINGERFPEVTIEEVALGSDVIVEVRNLSPTEHPFHVHGVAFEVLSLNGVAPPRRTMEDTINVGVRDVVRLRVFADNPGDWMTHCHILPHAGDGMMTVLRILDP